MMVDGGLNSCKMIARVPESLLWCGGHWYVVARFAFLGVGGF